MEVLDEVGTASAGDNYLLSEKVPLGEQWIIHRIQAENVTNPCTARLELSYGESGVWSIEDSKNMSGVTAHHGVVMTPQDLVLDQNWRIRVLMTYCALNDVISATMRLTRIKRRLREIPSLQRRPEIAFGRTQL